MPRLTKTTAGPGRQHDVERAEPDARDHPSRPCRAAQAGQRGAAASTTKQPHCRREAPRDQGGQRERPRARARGDATSARRRAPRGAAARRRRGPPARSPRQQTRAPGRRCPRPISSRLARHVAEGREPVGLRGPRGGARLERGGAPSTAVPMRARRAASSLSAVSVGWWYHGIEARERRVGDEDGGQARLQEREIVAVEPGAERAHGRLIEPGQERIADAAGRRRARARRASAARISQARRDRAGRPAAAGRRRRSGARPASRPASRTSRSPSAATRSRGCAPQRLHVGARAGGAVSPVDHASSPSQETNTSVRGRAARAPARARPRSARPRRRRRRRRRARRARVSWWAPTTTNSAPGAAQHARSRSAPRMPGRSRSSAGGRRRARRRGTGDATYSAAALRARRAPGMRAQRGQRARRGAARPRRRSVAARSEQRAAIMGAAIIAAIGVHRRLVLQSAPFVGGDACAACSPSPSSPWPPPRRGRDRSPAGSSSREGRRAGHRPVRRGRLPRGRQGRSRSRPRPP